MMIIVGYITGDSSTESQFVEHEQVVKALGSRRLHPAFGNGVCYRHRNRGLNHKASDLSINFALLVRL